MTPRELERFILDVLEANDTRCMDDKEDRQVVAKDIAVQLTLWQLETYCRRLHEEERATS